MLGLPDVAALAHARQPQRPVAAARHALLPQVSAPAGGGGNKAG